MAKTAKKADVEVLPAPLPEQGLVQTESLTIVSFLNGLVPFFRTAAAIEAKAKATLAKARTFTLPKPGDVDGDAALQSFIKEASTEIKLTEKHWEITSGLYQFQKKLVAARDRVIGDGGKTRSDGYLVEAKNIAQRLHNTFVEDAKRRAADEQARLLREEEARQAEIRRQDLARMENEALEAEAASTDLSDRETRFVALVHSGVQPGHAAQTVGYKNAALQGQALMQRQKIQTALKGKRDAEEIRRQAEAVKAAPLDVQVETVKAQKTSVGVDRTTYTMEVFDPRLLVEAVVGGRHGIPADILMPDQTRANAYARDLREVVNRWPGCRLVKKTTTV